MKNIPTNRSTRTITEGAVVALVQGKIDALQRKVDDFEVSRFRSGQQIATNRENLVKIGALLTVISGLRWCPDAETDPNNVGGNFPILDEGE